MKNVKLYFITLLALVFQSCSEQADQIVDNVDSDMVAANSTADFTSELDFNTGIDIANSNASFSNRSALDITVVPACATITVNNTTPGVFPKIFTVNFSSGCNQNGISRSGKLTITLSDYVMNNGSTMTIERDNYFVNSKKIEGTVVYTNETTTATVPQWTRTITNGKITFQNGDVFTHSGTRTVRQTAGVATATLGDNTYEIISGMHTINRPNGSTLTSSVVQPLIKKFACNYISKGQIELEGTVLNGILDYGNDECDNFATYTHTPNGQIYYLNL